MKNPIVLIAAIVAVLGLGAAVAVAKETIKVPTSVSIHASNFAPGGGTTATFSGKVTAKKGCKKHRKVVLHEEKPGVPGSTAPGVRGFDRTNNRGEYTIKKYVREHRVGYIVSATKKIIENDGEKIVCKRAKSGTFYNY